MNYSIEQLFERTIPEPNTGCILWMGPVNHAGYGLLITEHTRFIASRAAWMLVYGDIPHGICVCHRCDTPLCVNTHHLFLGDRAQNSADRNSKLRQARGEKHGSARLNEERVLAIRDSLARGSTQRELARLYGVSAQTIGDVATGRCWGFVRERAPDTTTSSTGEH